MEVMELLMDFILNDRIYSYILKHIAFGFGLSWYMIFLICYLFIIKFQMKTLKGALKAWKFVLTDPVADI